MFRERIWYLIVAFFIIFSGSILYTFNKTKVYTAASQVQLFRDDASALGSYGQGAEMELNQILRCRRFQHADYCLREPIHYAGCGATPAGRNA